MNIELILVYSIILIFFCLEYFLHYKFVNTICPDLTEKQKAHILSIKNTLGMCLIGLYFNYHYFTSKCNETLYFTNLESKGGMDFGKVIVLYFTAYLIMDLYIGHYDYRKYMHTLTSYFHHTIYCFINMISLYFGIFPVYLLHMFSELPAFIMGIGQFDIKYRNDNLFGLTFFLTRILYHIYLTWTFRHNNIVLGLSLATLTLHFYWFKGWITKYFINNKDPTKSKNTKSKDPSQSKACFGFETKSKNSNLKNTKLKNSKLNTTKRKKK